MPWNFAEAKWFERVLGPAMITMRGDHGWDPGAALWPGLGPKASSKPGRGLQVQEPGTDLRPQPVATDPLG